MDSCIFGISFIQNRERNVMLITTLAIDIAKNVFFLHGQDELGKPLLQNEVSRGALAKFVVKLPVCRIVMVASGGSHYWARKFVSFGHTVELISPQYVKPFVKTNKNDRNDAEAICEAASLPTMRYVPSNDLEQQDIQSLHRVRQRLITQRTSVVNQIRGLLHEYGIVVSKSPPALKKKLPEILEDGSNELTYRARHLFDVLRSELIEIENRLTPINTEI